MIRGCAPSWMDRTPVLSPVCVMIGGCAQSVNVRPAFQAEILGVLEGLRFASSRYELKVESLSLIICPWFRLYLLQIKLNGMSQLLIKECLNLLIKMPDLQLAPIALETKIE